MWFEGVLLHGSVHFWYYLHHRIRMQAHSTKIRPNPFFHETFRIIIQRRAAALTVFDATFHFRGGGIQI